MKPPREEEIQQDYVEYVVKINRCATVVKGGRRFSFSALVVVGNKNGKVGIGFGKANEVPPAVQKAVKDAKKNSVKLDLCGDTIAHEVIGKFGATEVFMKPAAPGTGVIAGAAVRAIAEAAGIKNILSKAYGSTNPVNLTKAALKGLQSIRSKEQLRRLRGVEIK
ncbi:MAG: 30S ribosomal protein S5 [Candidatus Brocadiae bacterium]|nr:30S ribosomal protein S5 [Candidatus Brocadiia bacterium]